MKLLFFCDNRRRIERKALVFFIGGFENVFVGLNWVKFFCLGLGGFGEWLCLGC